MQPLGLTRAQWGVLARLYFSNGVTQSELADELGFSKMALGGLLDRLEAKGLVSRSRLDNDRRCVVCRITNRGLELLTELDHPVAAAHDRVLGALDPADAGQLIEFLDAIRTPG